MILILYEYSFLFIIFLVLIFIIHVYMFIISMNDLISFMNLNGLLVECKMMILIVFRVESIVVVRFVKMLSCCSICVIMELILGFYRIFVKGSNHLKSMKRFVMVG
jgi:hypothetical protein